MEFKNLCKNLHHIGIIVEDIEKELKLYKGILGYEIARDTGEKGLEKEYTSVVGFSCMSIFTPTLSIICYSMAEANIISCTLISNSRDVIKVVRWIENEYKSERIPT